MTQIEDLEKPHYIPIEDGIPGYWRVFGEASDGETFMGKGKTSNEAVEDVMKSINQHEQFLKTSYEDQLRQLTSKDMSLEDVFSAVKLLTLIVLKEKS